MKKIFLITLFLIPSIFAFSQTQGLDKKPLDGSTEAPFTAKLVKYMAIFPGCETIDENDKFNLQKCVSTKLSDLLSNELKAFYTQMERDGYSNAVAKVEFVIDKHGKIVNAKALKGGNNDLGIAAEKAFERISSKLKKIRPAILEDGTPVNLVFQLPISLRLNISFLNEFEWKEMTLATLKDGEKIYEIRQDKSKDFKVYEMVKEKEFFLGKFISSEEIFNSEPYKTIIRQNNNPILMAEKFVKNEYYRMYYSVEKPGSIDVFKVSGGNEIFIETIFQKDLEGYRNYLAVVLRN